MRVYMFGGRDHSMSLGAQGEPLLFWIGRNIDPLVVVMPGQCSAWSSAQTGSL